MNISYEIITWADERKTSSTILNTIKNLWDCLDGIKMDYDTDGDFDSIQVITYNNETKIEEEWIHM